MEWLDQLVDQNLLRREDEYRTLAITPQGWGVLRSQAEARLYQAAAGRGERPEKRVRRRRRARQVPLPNDASQAEQPTEPAAQRPLDADERALFEHLRNIRRAIADEMNAPAFVVFHDRALREMARARPTNEAEMLGVNGVGPAKCARYGPQFIEAIQTCPPDAGAGQE